MKRRKDVMVRLFACDLDGTLLNKYHETDDVILDAVDQVIKNNRYFAIATGRHMHENQKEKLGMYHRRCIYDL